MPYNRSFTSETVQTSYDISNHPETLDPNILQLFIKPYFAKKDYSLSSALWRSSSYFVNQADIVRQLINKFGYIRNTLLISLNMNIVKVNLSNNGLSLTNITKYDISFPKHPVTKVLKIIIGSDAQGFPCPHTSFQEESPKLSHPIKRALWLHHTNVNFDTLIQPVFTVFSLEW